MKLITLFIVSIFSYQSYASELRLVKTVNGVEYGFKQGDKNKPLVLVFTTDIKSSLTGKFSTLEASLSQSGFSTASVDVTCHGKDRSNYDNDELKCWADRAAKYKTDIFSQMVINASESITDVQSKQHVSTDAVIVIGVSRGGYAALRLARVDKRVTHLILLSPVTNIGHLSEFKNTSFNDDFYNLSRDSNTLSNKNIFLQIGNSDDRVGTAEALTFMHDVVSAKTKEQVNFTAVISPILGHAIADEDIAKIWIINQLKKPKYQIINAP